MKMRRRKVVEWLGTGVAGFLAVCLVLGFAGCGGEMASKSDSQTDKEGESHSQPASADYLGAVNRAKKSAIKTVNVASVQQVVRQFQAGEGRLPRSLKEVVSSGYIARLPKVPQGLRLVYDPQTGLVSTASAQ